MAIDRPGPYAHLRRLPPHGRSPFRSCLHLVLAFRDQSLGILTSESFSRIQGTFTPQSRPCQTYPRNAREIANDRWVMVGGWRDPRDFLRYAANEMSKQRLEFDNGRSSKFWEVAVNGSTHTVRYGRIGTTGQEKTKSFDNNAAAEKDALRLISQKTQKGYTPVRGNSKASTRHKIPKTLKYRAKATLGAGSVNEAWDRIESWLTENLPNTKTSLNRPAKIKDIKALEKATGLLLPDDLKESYRRHDGQEELSAGVIFGLPLVPLGSVAGLWQHYSQYEKSKKKKYNFDDQATCFPVGYVQPVYRSKCWLPISHDFSGNSIVIDLSPGELGSVGQVIVCDRDGFHPVLALSWAQFLVDIAEELERGNWRIDQHGGEGIEFNLGTPKNGHFHDVGVDWSRRKLAIRKPSGDNETIWKQRTLER